jgi:hypothetical protein
MVFPAIARASVNLVTFPGWMKTTVDILLLLALVWVIKWDVSYLLARLNRRARKIEAGPWWSLDVPHLRVGDIIATSSSSKSSKLIRYYTGGGSVSHVALYLGGDSIVEAVWPRVRTRHADSYILTDKPTGLVVLRPKSSQCRLDEDALISEARFYFPNLYGVTKAIGVAFPRVRILSAYDAVICSELVMRAYRRGGIDLCPSLAAEEVSPNRICHNRDILDDVTQQCVRRVSPEQRSAIAIDFAFARAKEILTLPWRWFSLLVWIVSPARRSRAKHPRDWGIVDFWFNYLWLECTFQLHRVRFPFRKLGAWLHLRYLQSRPIKRISSGLSREFIEHLIATATARDQRNHVDMFKARAAFDFRPPEYWPNLWQRVSMRQERRSSLEAQSELGYCILHNARMVECLSRLLNTWNDDPEWM